MPAAATSLSAREQEVCAILSERGETMLADLGEQVAIPTGGNYRAGLDNYRDILTTRLEALGATTEVVEGRARPDWLLGGGDGPIPPCAVCTSEGMRRGDGAARILIACHLDTVFDPHGDFIEMVVSDDGKTASGPGVVDMKGGILVAINALEALREAGVPIAWTFLLTSDEESGSYCSEHVLRDQARKHDVGLVTEPALPGGELAIERLGSGQFRIEAIGRSAHVGRDFERGVNAVTALAEAIAVVAKMPDPKRGRILSVGPLKGGDATNAVPDRAYAWGNARYPSKAIADETSRLLDTIEHEGDFDIGRAQVRVDRCFQRPAKPLIPETERLALAARAAAEALGQRLPFKATGGVCDGNILQDAGIPVIDTLGVRGGGLHTTGEWIEVASLVERAQLFAVLASRLAERGLDGATGS